MKIKNILALSLLLIPLLGHSIDLSPQEKEKVTKGKLAKDVKWRKEFVWPLVKIKALIPGTPEENMKGFTQFETHKKFIPDLLESKIVKHDTPLEWEVYCELKVPWPVNKSIYTTKNVVTVLPDGTQHLVWSMVKGDLLKATDGHVTFAPYEGKSLMEYESQIVPDSGFAGMFKKRVPEDVEKSVRAIIKQLGKSQPKAAAAK